MKYLLKISLDDVYIQRKKETKKQHMSNKVCIVKTLPNTHGKAISEKGKLWENGSTLKIRFLNGSTQQQNYVKQNCVEILKYVNLKFDFVASGDADIRITFNANDGAWSYVGTDCREIPQKYATMNLGWLDRAVVLHEFGHGIGALGHEHQSPLGGIVWNTAQVIKDLSSPPNNWSTAEIQSNVLDKYDVSQVNGTLFDPTSVMMYEIPASWVKSPQGFSSTFNEEYSALDRKLLSELYPADVVEPDPVDPDTKDISVLFKMVFLSEKDIKPLTEAVLIRIGTLLGLEMDEKLSKAKNLKKVSEALFA